MRIDNSVAYVVTGIFVIATLIVGAELLYSAKIAVETGDKGLLDLGDILGDRYGTGPARSSSSASGPPPCPPSSASGTASR